MSQFIKDYNLFKLKYVSSLIFLVVNLVFYIFAISQLDFFKSLFTLVVVLSVVNFLICFNLSNFFFEKFFTFYMWTGFVFFYYLHIIFFNQEYTFNIGTFDFSNNLHLKELYLVLIFFNLGILISIILSRKFLKTNYKLSYYRLSFFFEKKTNLLFYFILFIIICVFFINYRFKLFDYYYFSQPRYNFFIDSFLKWFFLFGFTSLMCIFLNLKLIKTKLTKFYYIIYIQEFLFYISILSRGCIFNSSAIFFASIAKNYVKYKYSLKFLAVTLFFIVFLFSANFYILIDERKTNNIENIEKYRGFSNLLMHDYFENNFVKIKNVENQKKVILSKASFLLKQNNEEKKENFLQNFKKKILRLIFVVKNRIFGIDSLMAVVSYEKKGFDLLKLSIQENSNPGVSSFFDQLRLQNDKDELTNNVTLPSIVGFLYYSGSYFFILISIIIIMFFCNFFEKLNIYFNNNIYLSAIIGQILAYRLWHFGYAPINSYKILMSLLCTIFLCYALTKLMAKFDIIQK